MKSLESYQLFLKKRSKITAKKIEFFVAGYVGWSKYSQNNIKKYLARKAK